MLHTEYTFKFNNNSEKMKKKRSSDSFLLPLNFWLIPAIILLLLAFVGTIGVIICNHTQDGSSIAWISAFIAIANALLLYATLQSQNLGQRRMEERADRDRFESTFFNLLKSHRQLINEIQIFRPSVKANDVSKVKNLAFTGRQFFSFALIDIANINRNLQEPQLNYYSPDVAEEWEEYISTIMDIPSNRDTMEDERKKMVKSNREAMVNTFYNITKEHQEEAKNNSHLAVQLFERKAKKYYEQYIRSLIHILEYIEDYGEDIDNYVDIVFSQMSEDEFYFIIRIAPINERLLNLIKGTRLYGKQFA